MPKLPRVTGADAKRAFSRLGFSETRSSGSHCIMKKEGHYLRLLIPIHAGKVLGKGLLSSLLSDAGISVEEFKKHL